MAEIMPVNIPIPAEPVIVSYDFTDFAEGTGVVVFEGFKDSAGNYGLSTSSNIPSAEIVTTATDPNTATIYFTLTPFNMPKKIKGTAIALFSAYATPAGGGANITVTIQKSSGGTVTDLGNAVTGNISGGGAVVCAVLIIPLTETPFKRGDILRAKCDINPEGSNCIMGHDPYNRTYGSFTASTPTKFRVNIPFKIEN
jgi:hypothetical protein